MKNAWFLLPVVLLYCSPSPSGPEPGSTAADRQLVASETNDLPGETDTASTVRLVFEQIDYSADDLQRPGFGLEYWVYQNLVRIPSPTSPDHGETNRYDRFEWAQLESFKDVYNFSAFDASIRTAIDRNQTFSFGIMNYCAGCNDYRVAIDNGFVRTYPAWLYREMKEDTETAPFFSTNDGKNWIPNWNNARLWTRFEALLLALRKHIEQGTYKGVPYRRVIRTVDLRGMGNFGEWHFYNHRNEMPARAYPTVESAKNLIDLYIRAFPDFQLQVSFDIFAAQGSGSWSEFPVSVAYHALTQKNNKGLIGWRRDSWGDNEKWHSARLENNPFRHNGVALKDLIMNRWKTAPVGGELLQCCTENDGIDNDAFTGEGPYWDLPRQMEFYHVSTLGNGNYDPYMSFAERYLPAGTDEDFQGRMRAASKRMGARFTITSGRMPEKIERGKVFDLTLQWQNNGVTPSYDAFYPVFELRKPANGQVVWSDTSSFVIRHWLPGTARHTDKFTLPKSVPEGTYDLFLSLKDSSGYQRNMPLFITGARTGKTGSEYNLRSDVTVAGSR